MNLKTPIEVLFNEANYNQNTEMYKNRIDHYQNIIDRVKNSVPGLKFDKNDLVPLFSSPKDFLATKTITEPTIINGVELDKTKVFELLSCNDELKQIISEIEVLNTNQNQESTLRFFDRYAQYYIINNSNKVEVNPETLAKLKESNTVYLKTEKQQILYDCAQKLIDIYNEIKVLNVTHSENIQRDFLEFSQGGSIKINIKQILQY